MAAKKKTATKKASLRKTASGKTVSKKASKRKRRSVPVRIEVEAERYDPEYDDIDPAESAWSWRTLLWTGFVAAAGAAAAWWWFNVRNAQKRIVRVSDRANENAENNRISGYLDDSISLTGQKPDIVNGTGWHSRLLDSIEAKEDGE